ncbi:hypothetical protein [Phocaeicola sp.]
MAFVILEQTNNEIMSRKSGYQTGIASEYLVLSMLYRLGADAYITMGNKKSIDIGVIKEDGMRISIDVKSVRGSDSIPVGNVMKNDNHYLIFVVYNNKFEEVDVLPDFYIVPSGVVMECRVEFNGNRVNIFKKDIANYKNKWEELGLY